MFPTSSPKRDHLKWLRDRGYTKDSQLSNPAMEPLKHKLLSFGGSAVILHFDEPDMDAIMSRGEITSGNDTMFIRGGDSACHSNSHAIWRSNPSRVTLCTGYALSDDGLWRQHSWVKINDQIAETTVQRVAYFGFDLTNEEAESWS